MAENEDKSIEVRLTRAEQDIVELKCDVKESCRSMTLVEKSNIRTEDNVEKILETLVDLKAATVENKLSLDENLKRTTATENLALNLKTDTDTLKKDVKVIKEKPAKDYDTLKWIIIGILVSNVVGIVWSMLIKH